MENKNSFLEELRKRNPNLEFVLKACTENRRCFVWKRKSSRPAPTIIVKGTSALDDIRTLADIFTYVWLPEGYRWFFKKSYNVGSCDNPDERYTLEPDRRLHQKRKKF